MIFFVGNDGTIIKGMPSPVYQGAANSNTIYLIAPFATNVSVTVAFQLPNGVWTKAAVMTPQNALQGIVNETTGQEYAGWAYDLPNSITQHYGTVTAQFFFYSAQAGVITASSATSFQVGRGVPTVLPDTPTQDIYEQILENISSLQQQLNNGTYAARAIYAWNSAYTYGANEITYYKIGQWGALVRSKKADNTDNVPYTGEEWTSLNEEWWEEVINFEQAIDICMGAATQALASEKRAAESAQTAAASAGEAVKSAESAESAAGTAELWANNAANSATTAAESAGAALQSAQEAKESAEHAQEIVDGIGSVYKPVGSISFAQLPQTPTEAERGYVYNITDDFTTDTRFVEGAGRKYPGGTNVAVVLSGSRYKYDALSGNVDLTNYAQINGTYPNMSVGKATNDENGDNIADTYAKKNYVGIVQEKNGQLPIPVSTDPYVILNKSDEALYVRKVYVTEDNTIYAPSSEYIYYYIVVGRLGSGFYAKYKIVWATSDGITFTTASYRASLAGTLRVSITYDSLDEAEAAIKSNTTEYTQETSLMYFAYNSSSESITSPIVNSNYDGDISYPASYTRRQNGVIYEFTWTHTNVNPYNPLDGYIEGTKQNKYVKLLDNEDTERLAQIDGTYPNMSVGSAVNVTSNINGKAITNIFEADGIRVKHASTALDVTKNINGKAITTIFESDGITVKSATHAGSATNATNVEGTINRKPLVDIFETDGTTVKAATTASNAVNVTGKINGNLITDIFDTDGVSVKKAINASIATQAAGATNATNANNYNTSYGTIKDKFDEIDSAIADLEAGGSGVEQVVTSVNGTTTTGRSIYVAETQGTAGHVLVSSGTLGGPSWLQEYVASVNGSTVRGKSIYAPTTAGTTGQVLQSNGAGAAPTWTDASGSGGGSNPNILINPDFKINQRATSSYTESASGYIYTVDRWRICNGSVTPHPDGTVSVSFNQGYTPQFSQLIENYKDYLGKTVTLTAKVSNVTGTIKISSAGMGGTTITADGIYSNTVTLSTALVQLLISVTNNYEAASATIEWMKLEVGDTATPYTPPDPAEELAKCQRYYQKVRLDGGSGIPVVNTIIRASVNIPVTMRKTPTITKKSFPEVKGYGTSSGSTAVNMSNLFDNSITVNVSAKDLMVGQVYILINGSVELDAEL